MKSNSRAAEKSRWLGAAIQVSASLKIILVIQVSPNFHAVDQRQRNGPTVELPREAITNTGRIVAAQAML
jgi:hypothetical protein